MLIDLTLKITPAMAADAQGNEKRALVGHLGTHFDIMDQEFPLEYTRRAGIVFDVSAVQNRDIDLVDISPEQVRQDMFVAFYTGFMERCAYGSRDYFTCHPQLAPSLIDLLLERGVSIIGVDFAGVRQGAEHPATDQRCAARGVFIVENLCNLKPLAGLKSCSIHTYPMNYAGVTGLPCRVIAEACAT